MSQNNGTPDSKPPRWTAEQKAAIEEGRAHDPDVCGLDIDGFALCPRCILLELEGRRRAGAEAAHQAEAEAEAARLRPEAEQIAQVIRTRGDIVTPALVEAIAEPVAKLVVEVLRLTSASRRRRTPK